ncbi:MAG TPA: translesion error-prone DNA polymerase V autoproteolytic subunit [Crocinitomix sp.]|nr:translesion error-prone DNA polymerase V autoproteolytic subunit [Crocinitomix sp.]
MKLIKTKHTLSISFFKANVNSKLELALSDSGISAGFPSPAQDFTDLSIDLNKELIKNPSTTFYGRVSGESMTDLGINDGDLVIIDKSLPPLDGKIAVCFIDGEFTMKSIKLGKDCCWLLPANPQYKPIKVTADNNFLIWGIVIHVIKSF